jgi:hypothetical protein
MRARSARKMDILAPIDRRPRLILETAAGRNILCAPPACVHVSQAGAFGARQANIV